VTLMHDFKRPARLIKNSLLVVLLLVAGCSSGVATHDAYRAAELVVDFFTGLKSSEGTRLAYAWTDDKYKQEVPFEEFSRIVAFIRETNRGAEIRLVGFEVFGRRETFVVYANSKTGETEMHFKLTLAGTKNQDYYLLALDVDDSAFAKTGIYREYPESIVIEGV
jgi:hypothetical protein